MINDEIPQNSNPKILKEDDLQKVISGLPVSYVLLPLIPSGLLPSNFTTPPFQSQQNNTQQQPSQQIVSAESVLTPNEGKDSIFKILLIPIIVISTLFLAGYFGFNYVNGKMTGKMKASIMQSAPNVASPDPKDSITKDQPKNVSTTPPQEVQQKDSSTVDLNHDKLSIPTADSSIPKDYFQKSSNSTPLSPDNKNSVENLPIKR